MRNYIIRVCCFAFSLGCLMVTGCESEKNAEQEKIIRPVRYITVIKEGGEENRTFSGTASAGKQSALSFKLAGTIKKIPVKVGEHVKAGTLLAEVDSADFEIDYDSAVANLNTAKADAEVAKTAVNTTRSNYGRVEKLYEQNNVSLSEFEQARGEYETAQAQLKAALSRITTADSELKASKNKMNYTRLIAPFEGVINTIGVDENEEVSSGATIMTLSSFGKIDVIVNLSDLFITRVKKDMVSKVSFPAIDGGRFDGVVTEVPYAAAGAPTYPVTIRVNGTDSRLRPGMAADVHFSFKGSNEDALFLPTDAVGKAAGKNFVFVLEKQDETIGVARKRDVTIGELTTSGFLIVDGLQEGELVATSGLQMLLDGMSVKLVDDPVRNW